jgi:hypothetical protein
MSIQNVSTVYVIQMVTNDDLGDWMKAIMPKYNSMCHAELRNTTEA